MKPFSLPPVFSLKGNEKRIVKIIDRLGLSRADNLSFIDPTALKLAAVPIKLRAYRRLEDLVRHFSDKVGTAAHSGAQIAVLPELCGMAALTLVPKYERLLSEYRASPAEDKPQMMTDILYEYSDYIQEVYFTLFSELACQYGIYLLAGSVYLLEGDKFYNRAFLFDPDGDIAGYQDKLHLSEDEAAVGIQTGSEVRLIDIPLGRMSIAVGQDNAYFEVYRVAKGMGAQLMLCPCAGLNYGCRNASMADAYLRVQETALYAVKSTLTGDIMQRRYGGTSGVYCPVSIAEEKKGILASNESDPERALVCRVNLPKLDAAFNPYACDRNEDFYVDYAEKHYGFAKVYRLPDPEPEPAAPEESQESPSRPERLLPADELGLHDPVLEGGLELAEELEQSTLNLSAFEVPPNIIMDYEQLLRNTK